MSASLAAVARQHLGLPKSGIPRRQGRDLIGEKFARLTVIKYLRTRENGKRVWLCKCDCGNVTHVVTSDLTQNRTLSCGCLKNEKTAQRSTTHGMSGTKTFYVWRAMKQRCTNPKNRDYAKHGGRGISYCDSWDSFQNFLNDMGACPDDCQLARHDESEHYNVKNCVWLTRKQLAEKHSPKIEFDGKSLTHKQWARRLGITPSQLYRRLKKLPIEQALTRPRYSQAGRRHA